MTDDPHIETRLLCYNEGLRLFEDEHWLYVHYTEVDPCVYLLPGKSFVGSQNLMKQLKELQKRLSIMNLLVPVNTPSSEDVEKARNEMVERQYIMNHITVIDDELSH